MTGLLAIAHDASNQSIHDTLKNAVGWVGIGLTAAAVYKWREIYASARKFVAVLYGRA